MGGFKSGTAYVFGSGKGFAAASSAPTPGWTFKAGSSGVGSNAGAVAVTATITPATGDLLCLMAWQFRTTPFTSVAISDNGSGGWTSLGSFRSLGTASGQAYYKIATAADFNSGSGITVTATAAGGSGTIFNNFVEVDVFGLVGTSPVLDISSSASTSLVTTDSISPAAGSTHAAFTDELAWTGFGGQNGGTGAGPPTGSNTFTGTSAAKALTECIATNDHFVFCQYATHCQASATAGTNVWKNTWTNPVNDIFFGATFAYTPS